MSSVCFIRPGVLQLDARSGECVCLDSGIPELSWNAIPLKKGAVQRGYRILAAAADGKILWDSGVVASNETRWIPWGGDPLPPNISGTVRVQLLDQGGNLSESSMPQAFCTGYFSNAEWGKARWIWFDRNNYSTTAPSPYFRKVFCVHSGLASARLSITARGVFEAYLDGMKISADLLAPGWTDFRKQIPYLVYPLQLTEGTHTVGAILADGWCCGNLTILRYRNFYHDHPELLAQLELVYADGSREIIVSDSSWKCATGPVISADLYDGEDYDARLEMPGWCTSQFDDSRWIPAAEAGTVQDSPPLVTKTAPPVRVTETLEPVQILHPRRDTYIWDFGQNFAGSYRVRLRGIPGRRYTFRTAEMLEKDGTLYTLNYRSARSQDSYICAGPADTWQVFSPSFTFHGFRYLQIDGFQFENLAPESLEVQGIVMRSDIPVTADFTCGNPLVSRLWLNALWGQKSNFLEIPTDCPQRDERLGWTGDAEIFAPTAMYNGDCCTFFRKYLRDVREAMTGDGAAPSIAPAVLRMLDGAAGWGDAIVLIPYQLYRHYGWKRILLENYDAMCRAIRWQECHSCGFLFPNGQFGDWLAPEETPRGLVAAAYFVHCVRCLSEIADILGKPQDCKAFIDLEHKATRVFRKNFLDADGLPQCLSQTSLLLVLAFQLVAKERRQVCIRLLRRKIRDNGSRLSTGFLGTALLLPTLAATGLQKLACALILQEKFPSWLFSVKQGATTIWERWDSYSARKGFGNVSMNSFNHYAYGTVAHFLFTEIGGIHYDNDRILFRILPDRRFSPVNARYDSPAGTLVSRWHYDEKGRLHWTVLLPAGISAKAECPDGSFRELHEGKNILQ